MKREIILEKVSIYVQIVMEFIKGVYTYVINLANASDECGDMVALAFNIVHNIKIAKENAELACLGNAKEINPNDIDSLCCEYVKLYRVLDLLRSTCIYISHENGLGKSIISVQDQIESTLYNNNEELWFSTQRLEDMYQKEVINMKESIIFKRFISEEYVTMVS